MQIAISEWEIPMDPTVVHGATRKKLEKERPGIVHKFSIAGHKGIIRTGVYDDGRLGEIFIDIHKEGSTLGGILESFATVTSIALQYGVPLEVLASKFIGSRFDPQGITQNPDIRQASSILDYLFRWLVLRYGTPDGPKLAPVAPPLPEKVLELAEPEVADGES